jgi:hypothetical protein
MPVRPIGFVVADRVVHFAGTLTAFVAAVFVSMITVLFRGQRTWIPVEIIKIVKTAFVRFLLQKKVLLWFAAPKVWRQQDAWVMVLLLPFAPACQLELRAATMT